MRHYTSFTEAQFTELFGSIYDYMNSKGYGKISRYSSALYRGYKASKEVAALKNGNLSEKLQSADSLYNQIKNMSFTDNSIRDEHIKRALSTVEKARSNLEQCLYNYIYHPDQDLSTERYWTDNIGDWFKKVTGKCPVDFTVFDEMGNIIGYTEGSYCEYEDSIYIEMSGEVETIYIPNDMNVRIIAAATGNGSMSYSVEQYAEGSAVRRLNYYDIPIVEGETYEQEIIAGSISENLEQLPLTDLEGKTIYGTELLNANSSSINNVSCWVTEGGTVYGAGEYVRGDSAEMIAYAEDGYSFEGWFINDTLVETNEVYRFAVTEDVNIGAIFKPLPSEQVITCEDSFEKEIGDEPFSLNASSSGDSILYYYSENEAIAEVSEDGTVIIKSSGTTEIFIVANATEDYSATSKSVMLTVNERKKDISDCTVVLSETSYTYNGSDLQPTVMVKDGSTTLKVDVDYTLSYTDNKNAGTASVSITGIGNYTGTVSENFVIDKASPILSFASDNITKKKGDSAFTNVLSKTTDGDVIFTSSDETVAIVDPSSGEVTIKGAGSTQITVTAQEGTNYKTGTSAYILNVEDEKYFTVRYNGNGGTGSMSDTTVIYGVKTPTTKNAFTRTGYKFKGWNIHRQYDGKWYCDGAGWQTQNQIDTGGYKKHLYADGVSLSTTSSRNKDIVTLYAVWEKEESAFTVKFNPNQGTGEMDDVTVIIGTPQEMPACTFVKEGYRFKGWNVHRASDNKWYTGTVNGWQTQKDINENGYTKHVYGDKVKLSTTSRVAGDTISLYAVWEKTDSTFTVKFKPTLGTGEMDDVTVNIGTPQEMPACSFVRDGYQFKGWTVYRASDKKWYTGTEHGWQTQAAINENGYTKHQYGDRIKLSTTSRVSGDTITLYAQWKAARKYNVAYDANGGIGTMDGQLFQYGVKTETRKNAFIRGGYKFTGWNILRKSDNKWYCDGGAGWQTQAAITENGYTKHLYPDGIALTTTTSVDGDTVTLYAQWKNDTKTYTVSYDAEGGSGSMSSQTFTVGVKTPTTQCQFSRDGYAFKGWNIHRSSDNKWYCDGGAGWQTQANIDKFGYIKHLYPDGINLTSTTSVNGDTVTLHAVWQSVE